MLGQLLDGDSSVADMMRTPGTALRKFVRLVDDVKPLLGRVTCPALLSHPGEDEMSNMPNSGWLVNRLSGLMKCVILDDLFHMIAIDRQRDLAADTTSN